MTVFMFQYYHVSIVSSIILHSILKFYFILFQKPSRCLNNIDIKFLNMKDMIKTIFYLRNLRIVRYSNKKSSLEKLKLTRHFLCV